MESGTPKEPKKLSTANPPQTEGKPIDASARQEPSKRRALWHQITADGQTRKAKGKASQSEDTPATRTIARFTVVLAVVAALQLIALTLQSYFNWRAADASERQANGTAGAFKVDQRPYMSIRASRLTGLNPGEQSQMVFVFKNNGKTPAKLSDAFCDITITTKPEQTGDTFKAPTMTADLGAGESTSVSLVARQRLPDEVCEGIKSGKYTLQITMEIKYTTIWGDKHSDRVIFQYSTILALTHEECPLVIVRSYAD